MILVVKFKSIIFDLLLITILICFLNGCFKQTPEKQISFNGRTMGTTYSIKLYPANSEINTEQLQEKITQVLSQVDRTMSTYKNKSDISQFNQLKSTQWINFPAELVNVISEAQRIAKLTKGSLDITVGALVDLWGFGKITQTEAIPDSRDIEKLLQIVGFENIDIHPTRNQIKKRHPDISIDLSAIAKGYGVDKVSELLEKEGIHDFLVEIGGEISVMGLKNNTAPWILAVEKPSTKMRSIHQKLTLTNQSMATSGNYRNYFEKAGKRYSHIINPKTGRPINHSTASVSVVHSSCMTADAWATGLLAMGYEKGYQLAEQKKLAVYFIYRKGDQFINLATTAFKQYLNKK
mgnify:CR=1 FL=1|jgi:FAD:protein FMN transferase